MNVTLEQIFMDECEGDIKKQELLPVFMAGALAASCLVEIGKKEAVKEELDKFNRRLNHKG